MNTYLDEHIARERIAEARAAAAQLSLVRHFASVRRPMREILGHALIRLGHWVAGRAQRHTRARRVTA